MNPFTLIGICLVFFHGPKYCNAIPVASINTNSDVPAENITVASNNDEKLENLLYYSTTDASKSSENVGLIQSTVTQTTQKPYNGTQNPKQKSKYRRRLKRRKTHTQPDCRTASRRPTMTTTAKTTASAFVMPNLFISTGWGPGR